MLTLSSAAIPVDDDIGLQGKKFACSGLAAGPAAEGKDPQAIGGEKEFAAGPLGSDRIVSGDVADDSLKIGKRAGTPNDGQNV